MNAVTFESEAIDLDTLVIAAVASGDWALERAIVRRAAAAAAAGERPDGAQLAAREEEFRRERGLWAAEDLTGWLDARDLTVGDWRAHLRRRLLAEATALGGPDTVPAHSREQVDAARVALLLDGVLAAAAGRLEQGAGAAALLGASMPGDDELADAITTLADAAAADDILPLERREPHAIAGAARQVVRLDTARWRLAEQITEQDIEAAIAERRADWTLLEFDGLSLSSENEAREAVMCVRDDGLALATVGDLAGAEVATTRALAENVPGYARHLLGARPGQVLGPIGSGELFDVIVLRARRAPVATDPAVAARARDAVARARISRRIAGRVRRHVEL